jgi:hypothetical protein
MNPAGDKADRHKDRLSYTQGNYRVDLTQVTQPEPGPSVRNPPPPSQIPLHSTGYRIPQHLWDRV